MSLHLEFLESSLLELPGPLQSGQVTVRLACGLTIVLGPPLLTPGLEPCLRSYVVLLPNLFPCTISTFYNSLQKPEVREGILLRTCRSENVFNFLLHMIDNFVVYRYLIWGQIFPHYCDGVCFLPRVFSETSEAILIDPLFFFFNGIWWFFFFSCLGSYKICALYSVC